MTTGMGIFWRVFAADVLLTMLWMILGGSLLESILMAILQGVLLAMVEGVIRAAHQLMDEVRERRIEKWERRRSR